MVELGRREQNTTVVRLQAIVTSITRLRGLLSVDDCIVLQLGERRHLEARLWHV